MEGDDQTPQAGTSSLPTEPAQPIEPAALPVEPAAPILPVESTPTPPVIEPASPPLPEPVPAQPSSQPPTPLIAETPATSQPPVESVTPPPAQPPADALIPPPTTEPLPAPQDEAKPKSTMPLIVGAIVVLILVIVGVYFIFFQGGSKQTVITPTQTTSGKIWNIIYANDIFDPASITIQKGDSVIFVDQGASSALIESDPHPAHSGNAELNLGMLNVGKSLSAQMNSVGTWGYHNDLNTSQTGTIIVTE